MTPDVQEAVHRQVRLTLQDTVQAEDLLTEGPHVQAVPAVRAAALAQAVQEAHGLPARHQEAILLAVPVQALRQTAE